MLLYKKNIFKCLAFTVGHQLLYSDIYFLNQSLLGFHKKILFYTVKAILHALFKIKTFLRTLKKTVAKFLFLLVFSYLQQYLIVSKQVESLLAFSKSNCEIKLVLTPKRGFFGSRTEHYLQRTPTLPLKFSYLKIIVFSMGDEVLPISVSEVSRKNTVLIGLVDTNQKRVLTGVDYFIPGNDDCAAVSYFLTTFLFNLVLI